VNLSDYRLSVKYGMIGTVNHKTKAYKRKSLVSSPKIKRSGAGQVPVSSAVATMGDP
jgi:hypothetical protein